MIESIPYDSEVFQVIFPPVGAVGIKSESVFIAAVGDCKSRNVTIRRDKSLVVRVQRTLIVSQ